MNDLETLRAALRTPPPEPLRPPELDRVMLTGSRLRRRRSMAVASCAAAAVILTTAGSAVLLRGGGGAAPLEVRAEPAASVPVDPCPGHTEPIRSDCLLGDVIATGIVGADGELVFYVVGVEAKEVPLTHFGVMAGRRGADGTLSTGVLSNESDGPDLAPGFHAVQAPTVAGIPQFGYYVGPATRITGRAGAQTVVARQAPWSQNPAVVVFWFGPDAPAADITDLKAFDAQNVRLPDGNSEVGHG